MKYHDEKTFNDRSDDDGNDNDYDDYDMRTMMMRTMRRSGWRCFGKTSLTSHLSSFDHTIILWLLSGKCEGVCVAALRRPGRG